MSATRRPTVEAVLRAVASELAEPAAARRGATGGAADSARQALELARSLQAGFRAEPVGGRLVALKRVVYWFVASAFDRQAKAAEALLPAVEALAAELVALRREVAELRQREGGPPPAAG